jgi:PAS domain S-box-containing protein
MSEASALYEKFFGAHPLAHCVLGPDGRFVYANRAYEVLFGSAPPGIDDANVSTRVAEARARALVGEAATLASIALSARDGRRLLAACDLYWVDHPQERHVVVVFERVSQPVRGEDDLRIHAELLNRMTGAVTLSDDQGVIVYANQAAEQMFGYGPNELCGKPASVKACPDTSERIEQVTAELRAHGHWAGEWLNVRRDGSRFFTRTRITALDRHGKRHWLSVQEDISVEVAARQRGEELAELLAFREEQLRLITNAMPAMIGYVGTDLRYRFANANYRRWFGLEPSQIVGLHMRELLGDAYPPVEPHIARALAGETVSYERLFVAHDGASYYMQPNYIPDFDSTGKLRGIAILVLDVTARRRAEMAVEAERRRFETVLMEAPAAISLRGRDRAFSVVNPVYQAVMGGHDLIGRTAREALPFLERQGYANLLDEVFATGAPMRLHEARLELEDAEHGNSERFFNLSYQPMRNAEGQVDAVVTFAVDVTELVQSRRRAEALAAEAAAANRAKDEFLAMLGHELRNPLAPILSTVELMNLTALGAFERERAVIERHVGDLTRLVDDLLDVSRVTSKKVVVERGTVDLRACLSTAVETVKRLLDERQHAFSFEMPEDLNVDGDALRLQQVFSNLLTNAAKYSPPGGSVALIVERAGNRVKVSVRDSGVGLSAEMRGRVFEPFVQAERPLDRAEGGLGLGLAIVRGLVELHEGKVEALSDGEGLGSTFVVTLPLSTHRVQPRGAAAAEARTANHGALRSRQILLVDDNVDAGNVLAAALTLLGHTVQTASDGRSALALLETFAAEIALLDIGLPEMDGYELARRIRQRASPPVLIALTGYGDPAARRASASAGFERHLVKPVRLEVLAELLERIG